MKWFKHQAAARNDEKIARLEDKSGLEGYGFYFKMLEIVSEIIDPTDRCDVTYSLSRWGRQVNITSKKFLFLLQCCVDVGLMSVQRVDDDITIKIPNLLKYRDNHTKNLQATSKQEVDKDKEEEQIKSKKKKEQEGAPKDAPPATEKFVFVLPEWVDEIQWNLWMKTRKKKMIPEQMQAQIEKLNSWRNSGLDHSGALANSATNGWEGLFLPEVKKSSLPAQSDNDQVREAARKRIFGGQNATA